MKLLLSEAEKYDDQLGASQLKQRIEIVNEALKKKEDDDDEDEEDMYDAVIFLRQKARAEINLYNAFEKAR